MFDGEPDELVGEECDFVGVVGEQRAASPVGDGGVDLAARVVSHAAVQLDDSVRWLARGRRGADLAALAHLCLGDAGLFRAAAGIGGRRSWRQRH